MPENYKQRYEQMKKLVTQYQDEIVPGLRKKIEELEQNQVKVRCLDCVYYTGGAVGMCKQIPEKPIIPMVYDNYCKFGKRRTDG